MFTREGGSIPVVSTFQEVLGLPTVLFGVGLPDENAHAPNEKLDLGNFHNGIIASALLYQEIAKSVSKRRLGLLAGGYCPARRLRAAMACALRATAVGQRLAAAGRERQGVRRDRDAAS